MRILLIAANTERISMVALPYGLGLVAAALRQAGHTVAFLDLLDAGELGAAIHQAIRESAPEVIGLSIRNIDDQNRQEPHFLLEKAREVVTACRAASQAPIVLGGPGYSIFPRETLAYLAADYGIRGDGEAAFPALLERLRAGRDPRDVPGVQVAGDRGATTCAAVTDLDRFPLWDDALERPADRESPEFWVPVQSRRGCPNDCSYCSTARIQGRAYRCRSPRQVADAVAALARRGYRRFYFVDNSFNLPEAQALALCRGLRPLAPAVQWRCILYPQGVGEELVRAMAASGCVEASLGFESGSPAILKEMNKRFAPDEVRRISDLLAAHGIRRMGFLLLGGPGETRETVEESLAFARSLRLDGLRVTVGIRIYPGTALARRAVREGVLADEADLLFPRFYLAPGLDPWLQARVAAADI
ncbi:B12-binding domain-containing radical SAM protein [Geothrix oryzisoli]|uniref:B12-binding domain-containing radical SAM protein n=1 Tax=Geothrix oryzisoli TaxID=2922721 RepID=UPI001FAE404D|nr:radical SAM protein [Geothrix oryzisoli]